MAVGHHGKRQAVGAERRSRHLGLQIRSRGVARRAGHAAEQADLARGLHAAHRSQGQDEQFGRIAFFGHQQDLAARAVDRHSLAVTRTVGPAECDRPRRMHACVFHPCGFRDRMQLQRATQAAVVAGIGHQQVVPAVHFECGEVFPIGLGDAVDGQCRAAAALRADGEQPRRIAAVIDQPQRIAMDMRRGHAADLAQLPVDQHSGHRGIRFLARIARGQSHDDAGSEGGDARGRRHASSIAWGVRGT